VSPTPPAVSPPPTSSVPAPLEPAARLVSAVLGEDVPAGLLLLGGIATLTLLAAVDRRRIAGLLRTAPGGAR